jgi:hypothetical protein
MLVEMEKLDICVGLWFSFFVLRGLGYAHFMNKNPLVFVKKNVIVVVELSANELCRKF